MKTDFLEMLNKIKEKESKQQNNKKVDPRFFVPTYKDDGTAEVLIRFLPSKDTDIPYVERYTHGFLGKKNKWYIENCPTTIGNDCPVCELNTEAWNSGDQNTARNRARVLNVYCNILVIKDPQNPENNGKVFLYRYGKKIKDKIMKAMFPGEDSLDSPVMVFDPKEGADFKLKIKQIKTGNNKKPMPNYDNATFSQPRSLTEEEIKNVEENLFTIAEFCDKELFKSYEELKLKAYDVLNIVDEDQSEKKEEKKEENSSDNDDIIIDEKAQEESIESPEENNSSSEDDEEDFFKQLEDM